LAIIHIISDVIISVNYFHQKFITEHNLLKKIRNFIKLKGKIIIKSLIVNNNKHKKLKQIFIALCKLYMYNIIFLQMTL